MNLFSNNKLLWFWKIEFIGQRGRNLTLNIRRLFFNIKSCNTSFAIFVKEILSHFNIHCYITNSVNFLFFVYFLLSVIKVGRVSLMLRVHLADDVDRILVLPPSQGENVIGSTYLTKEYSLVVSSHIIYNLQIMKRTKICRK